MAAAMKAEILNPPRRFEVEPAERADGTSGPPERLTITVRPCWQKPALKLELVLLYESSNVAYYYAAEG